MNSPSEWSDETAIRQLLDGDEFAFTAIYRNCSGPVYRFALYMTSDSHLAEEITQEAFLFLLASASSYDPRRGSLLAWLLGVARNYCRRALGAVNETEPLGESDECQLFAESELLEGLTRRELIEAVRDAIRSLPPALREVVILCELQELEYQEAAAVLTCPVGTIRSRLHRAKGLLGCKLKARCAV